MIRPKIFIKKNCLCGGELTRKINFGKLPIINDFKKIKTEKYPTIISQCRKCLLIQLKESVKDRIIYPKNYSYLSGDSREKLEDYNDLMSKLSKKFKVKKPNIIDIGGNDGSLMSFAKKQGYNVTNIEPTNVAKISKKKGIQTIKKEFNLNFSKKLSKKKKFDFVVTTNFFAHTNNLNNVIKGIKNILNENGVLVIEIQYLYKVLKDNGFDSIHQDHKYYYTLSSLNSILRIFNLYIFDAEFLKKQKEIIRVYVGKDLRKKTSQLKKILNKERDKNVINKIKKLNDFRKNYVSNLKKVLNNLILKNKKISAISASPRGCVLLNSCNLEKSIIKNVGEVQGSFKINKLIPGTNIPIKNEKILIKNQPDYILILAWHLKDRLKKILVKNGYKGKFIVPLPYLKIS